jgi:hypothetical protein
VDLRRGPCDIPSGRVEYRKAVLTSKWCLLSVEADWREATAGALAGRLAAEELVHRAMPPERIGAACDRTQGGCGEGVGSCEQFREAEGDGSGLWPRSIGAFDTLGGFGATFPPSSKGKSANNSGEPRWPTCQRVTTSSSRSPPHLVGRKTSGLEPAPHHSRRRARQALGANPNARKRGRECV